MSYICPTVKGEVDEKAIIWDILLMKNLPIERREIKELQLTPYNSRTISEGVMARFMLRTLDDS